MKLYIYEHCPFCVRAMMMLGLRETELGKVEQVVLLNDDEANPIRMIGVKQVPILEKDDGTFMGESLDIVAYLDDLSGNSKLDTHIRPEIQAWLNQVGAYGSRLTHPRCVQLSLPEFATPSAIAYFTQKKEAYIGSFAENLAQTPEFLAKIHTDLNQLVDLIGEDFVNQRHLSLEDIVLFPVLRNLTMVKGIEFPEKIQKYIENMAKSSGVNVYFDVAI